MDLQELADIFSPMTCIVSVEKKENGGYGEIHIVSANKGFQWLATLPDFDTYSDMISDEQGKFVPDRPYYLYLPRDPNFEDMCYRCAVEKEPIYTYVYLAKLDIWINVFAMPLDNDHDGKCYCSYTTRKAESSELAIKSENSADTLSDVLKTCIKLHGANDFRKTMDEVIKDIRRLCDAEVCTIMLMDSTTGTCSILASDKANDSKLRCVTDFDGFYDIANSWTETIGESDCLIVKSEKDIEYIREVNAPWYSTMTEAGVKSVVLFPLMHNSELLGYIWATNFDTENYMRIKETLELTTFFLSSQIASYKLMKRLQHISYTDLLTGVKNRNAMNGFVTDVTEDRVDISAPFGVIFADLNGLKTVNDLQGHTAGDILLKKAAILLQEVLVGDDIYRAGGDEFVAVVRGCSREDFERKVTALKERTRSNEPKDVCLSVGSCYKADGNDIRDAMHIADLEMYKDKEMYYKEHPERKHR